MTFTKDDVKRVAWTILQAGLAAAALVIYSRPELPKSVEDAKLFAIAIGTALLAGAFSAVKNLLTPTGSALK